MEKPAPSAVRCLAATPALALPLLLAALASMAAARAGGETMPLHLDRAAPAPALDASGPADEGRQLFGLEPDLAKDASLGAASDAVQSAGPSNDTPPVGRVGVPSVLAFPGRVGSDFVHMASRPFSFDGQDWTRLAIGAGAVGLAAIFDNRIRDSVQGHRSAATTNFANDVRPLGSWGGLAAMGLAWGAGALLDKPDLGALGADGLEATILASGVIAPALKVLVGRPRPRSGQAAGDLEPVSGGASFPSGEAAEAFSLAAVVSSHTQSRAVRAVAWGLAGLVGWERITLNGHWTSDVVAGALIGATVGTWVSRFHAGDERPGGMVSVAPLVGPGAYGVSATVSW